MNNHRAGRQYQDSVFRMYFNDGERLKEVASALHGTNYPREEHIQLMTLKGTFLSQLKNDISFLLRDHHLLLIEHQSTMNRNMALRCLYYVCEQLREYIPAKKLYQNMLVRIPAPEFHVFYTGTAAASKKPFTSRLQLFD
jgi:hypothetical protein